MMRWNRLAAVGMLSTLAGWAGAQTMDPMQVRGWASTCATCHGTAGIAQPGMESLAGVNKDEMLKKMMDFKTGKKISKAEAAEHVQMGLYRWVAELGARTAHARAVHLDPAQVILDTCLTIDAAAAEALALPA